MNKSFSVPRGTNDILPSEIPLWESVEAAARRVMKTYGYREIRTPIYEETGLFKRSLGQTSDIVNKQLLELATERDEGYALRPEGTASIVRSYIENSFDSKEGLSKLFYIGPMFRGERPQKGRLRQFHQIGVEAIGPNSASPYLDAEAIGLSVHLINAFGIKEFNLRINSLGTVEDKEAFSRILRQNLKPVLSKLCDDCRSRFERNVFRVLDCKNESCRAVVDAFEFGHDHLSSDSRKYFEHVRGALENLKIPFEVSPKLVRGLDYYTHTVFEISSSALGSQDALGAGGRYNNLVESLGGPKADAVGFALGIERILLAQARKEEIGEPLQIFIVALGEEALKASFGLLHTLRNNGVAADMSYAGGSIKSQMRLADKLGARYVAVIGDNELKSRMVPLKDMQKGEQRQVGWDQLAEDLKTKM